MPRRGGYKGACKTKDGEGRSCSHTRAIGFSPEFFDDFKELIMRGRGVPEGLVSEEEYPLGAQPTKQYSVGKEESSDKYRSLS